MSAEDGESKKEAIVAIVAKLRSQILLFSLAIALVIATAFSLSGSGAAWPIAAVLLVFLVGAGLYAFVESNRKGGEGAAVEGASSRGVMGAEEAIDAIRDAGSEAMQVEVWVRRASDGVASERFRIGEKIRIGARSTADGYLTLLNVGSDGELTVLFPNRRHQDNRIQKGRSYEIPEDGYAFDFTLMGPPGLDVVKAIVTADAVPLLATDFDERGEFFHSVASTAAPRAIKVIAREVERRPDRQKATASTRFMVE